MKNFNKFTAKFARLLQNLLVVAIGLLGIISALRHHGHTSINFLLGLGVTALIRSLITSHSNIWSTLATSASILVLVIAMVIFNKNLRNM